MATTPAPRRSCGTGSRAARSARRSTGGRLPRWTTNRRPTSPRPATTLATGRRPAMTDTTRPTTRRGRRDQEREALRDAVVSRREARRAERANAARMARLRKLVFGGIVVAVLAVGGYLAFGDFLNRP